MKTYSTKQVAQMLGVTDSAVRAAARRLGLNPVRIAAGRSGWTDEHIAELKARPSPGRPKKRV